MSWCAKFRLLFVFAGPAIAQASAEVDALKTDAAASRRLESPIPGSSQWWSCGHSGMYTCGYHCCCHSGFEYDNSKEACVPTVATTPNSESMPSTPPPTPSPPLGGKITSMFIAGVASWELVSTTNDGESSFSIERSFSRPSGQRIPEEIVPEVVLTTARSTVFTSQRTTPQEAYECTKRAQLKAQNCTEHSPPPNVTEQDLIAVADALAEVNQNFSALGHRRLAFFSAGMGMFIGKKVAYSMLSYAGRRLAARGYNSWKRRRYSNRRYSGYRRLRTSESAPGSQCIPRDLVDEYAKCLGTSVSEEPVSRSSEFPQAGAIINREMKTAAGESGRQVKQTCTVKRDAGFLWQVQLTVVSGSEADRIDSSLCSFCWTTNASPPKDPPGIGECAPKPDCKASVETCPETKKAIELPDTDHGAARLIDCGNDQFFEYKCDRGKFIAIKMGGSDGDKNKSIDKPVLVSGSSSQPWATGIATTILGSFCFGMAVGGE